MSIKGAAGPANNGRQFRAMPVPCSTRTLFSSASGDHGDSYSSSQCAEELETLGRRV